MPQNPTLPPKWPRSGVTFHIDFLLLRYYIKFNFNTLSYNLFSSDTSFFIFLSGGYSLLATVSFSSLGCLEIFSSAMLSFHLEVSF